MRFDKVINNLLKEEVSREDRIAALKSISQERKFNVEVYRGRGVEIFEVSGDTVFNALKQIPKDLFDDIFYQFTDFRDFEESEEALFDYLNIYHNLGTGINVNIYENGRLICGCDVEGAWNVEDEFEMYDDDEEGER